MRERGHTLQRETEIEIERGKQRERNLEKKSERSRVGDR